MRQHDGSRLLKSASQGVQEGLWSMKALAVFKPHPTPSKLPSSGLVSQSSYVVLSKSLQTSTLTKTLFISLWLFVYIALSGRGQSLPSDYINLFKWKPQRCERVRKNGSQACIFFLDIMQDRDNNSKNLRETLKKCRLLLEQYSLKRFYCCPYKIVQVIRAAWNIQTHSLKG